jgi:hypothetical protein
MRRVRAAGVILSAAMLTACLSDGPAAPVVIATPEVRGEPAPAEITPSPASTVASVETPTSEPVEAPTAEASAPESVPSTATSSSASGGGSLKAYLAALTDVSCPAAGPRRAAGEAVELAVKLVPLQTLNPSRKKIGELNFVAGFHLTSPDKRFGGLSGVDLLEDGNLLAVSDDGDFVWIDLKDDGVTPKAARISAMRDAKGEPLRGKAEGDAEGLAINGGTALVSYERDHRVLAYDVGRCGAAARGAPIVFGPYGEPLAQAFRDEGIDVDGNRGPEPLAVTRDWHLFTGIETKVGGRSPLSARPIESRPDFDLRLGDDEPEFVGLDLLPWGRDGQGVRAFSVHRGFSPLAGNAIVIMETDIARELDQTNLPRRIVSEIDERSHYRFEVMTAKKLAELNILLNVDNFEGIAARELPGGRVRLYLISDDNFSASQRTLLFVFETSN